MKGLPARWLRMIHREVIGAHIRKFYNVSGSPQAIGALDGLHIPISPPADHAVDYYNVKGGALGDSDRSGATYTVSHGVAASKVLSEAHLSHVLERAGV
ncbi:hypothetical protein HPB49_000366 [Dermacentor silvarum]|uniref:Uncharacterized protein n=1 Tax=Dermacentor silvarum TaxID=543639 RepID=A0ACB8CNP1_DERSI|nr:hypothetical protein HPB49_000366 [Dermacentor silvarum]